jgi:hypothetical protein
MLIARSSTASTFPNSYVSFSSFACPTARIGGMAVNGSRSRITRPPS